MTGGAPRRRRPSGRSAIIVLVIGGILFTSAMPLRRYLDVRAQIAALRQEERTLDERAAALTARKAELQTDAEIERLARERLGMVRPGETAFVIAKPPAKAEAPVQPPAGPAATDEEKDTPGVFSRWWDAVSQVVRAVR